MKHPREKKRSSSTVPKSGTRQARPWAVLYEPRPRARGALVQFLRAEGWAALQCEHASEAIAAARSGRRIDALLVDLESGVAVADEVRRLQPGVRVLFLSGRSGALRGGMGATSAGTAKLLRDRLDCALVGDLLRPAERTPRRRSG